MRRGALGRFLDVLGDHREDLLGGALGERQHPGVWEPVEFRGDVPLRRLALSQSALLRGQELRGVAQCIGDRGDVVGRA